MNKHIKDLQRYIQTGFMPASYSPFLEECKDVFDKKCQKFKAMLDRIETCEADTMQLIIKEVNPKVNRGKLIVCFFFAVYAKHKVRNIQNVKNH